MCFHACVLTLTLHTCIEMVKKSAIWNIFTVAEDTQYAGCNECKTSMARGGKSTKAFNMTNLLYHLQTKHTKAYSLYERQKAAKESQRRRLKPLHPIICLSFRVFSHVMFGISMSCVPYVFIKKLGNS